MEKLSVNCCGLMILYVIENGHKVKDLPYEGSLVELFDSRENLRSLLERTSQNILNAEIR